MKKNDFSTVADLNVAAVMVFENPEFGKIRICKNKRGEPLFCGKDVCDALGYKRSDLAVRQHVNQRDAAKRCIGLTVGMKKDGSPIIQNRLMIFVNESGFYALVLGSTLPGAQKFKLWVTSVVLPQIRKTGGFIPIVPGETGEETKKRAEDILRETLRQKDELIAQQEKLLDELLPKALYSDNVLDSVSCLTTTQIAKEMGMTAQELNRSLCAAHVQYYQSGQYMLYAEFAHMGLAKSRTTTHHVMCQVTEDGFKQGRVYTHTFLVWTERGRKFIHQLAEKYWRLAQEFQRK